MTDQTAEGFTPPAAQGLPAGTLEAAEIGANRLDAWARTPNGRNFLAHALVQLARTGWLRQEPGDGFEPMSDRPTAEPAPAVQAPDADRAALRDRIAEGIWARYPDAEPSRAGLVMANPHALADAVLAVLPAPTDRAAECSAQNRNYESGPRLCVRAAQHRGDHIDEHGFHWSDTVAIYPLADGTFRTGVNRAALRRMANEAQPQCPGYETVPNRCACPCEGCKHHCAAHQPAAGAQQGEEAAR
jgi:hypothetical protein